MSLSLLTGLGQMGVGGGKGGGGGGVEGVNPFTARLLNGVL